MKIEERKRDIRVKKEEKAKRSTKKYKKIEIFVFVWFVSFVFPTDTDIV